MGGTSEKEFLFNEGRSPKFWGVCQSLFEKIFKKYTETLRWNKKSINKKERNYGIHRVSETALPTITRK